MLLELFPTTDSNRIRASLKKTIPSVVNCSNDKQSNMKSHQLYISLLLFANFSIFAADSWKPLFDGSTLDGWGQRGGKAEYKVVEDSIVGTTVTGTPNSFLCTDKTYGDFILELEFKVDSKLNSGIQVRSECFDTPKTVEWKGKSLKIPEGRVHGYQVEIDPSQRAWSGGIYDEGRRGWLFDLQNNEAARKAFKPEAWNLCRIEAKGDSIKTWINGVPAADLKDSMTARGIIALQVHSHKEAGLQIKWRNIRIMELGK